MSKNEFISNLDFLGTLKKQKQRKYRVVEDCISEKPRSKYKPSTDKRNTQSNNKTTRKRKSDETSQEEE